MRKALIVGINFYESGNMLYGCVDDARAVNDVLVRNEDGSPNFETKLLIAPTFEKAIVRKKLRDDIEELFQGDNEVALFYFAGHAYLDATGGYICPSDAPDGPDGVALNDVISWADGSNARHKVVILDCCHGGIAGQHPSSSNSRLSDGTTILTASTAEQYASEEKGAGVFTTLLVDALKGAASNLVGEITPGSVYAHIDQSLGSWAQRPVFKTNVKNFVSLRKGRPALELSELRRICEFFPTAGFDLQLDPSYEPERSGCESQELPKPDSTNNETFGILQKMNRVNLVVPVGAPHMWHAAMRSKSCKLTPLGEHYRRLVENRRI